MALLIELQGNLLEPDTYFKRESSLQRLYLCHQVNCNGIMGGGIALSLKQKYPYMFQEYREFCRQIISRNPTIGKDYLLGQSQIVLLDSLEVCVVNLFGQKDTGTHVRQTSYDALVSSLEQFAVYLSKLSVSSDRLNIAFPKNLGCGLGGGDWNIVYSIIESFAKNLPEDVTVYIVEYVLPVQDDIL